MRNRGATMTALTNRMIAVIDKYYPQASQFYITSGTDGQHGTNSLHYSGQAVDIGAYDDPEPNDKDQRDMGLLADWLFENFWDLTLELIHTQPHNDHYTYVKNQRKVGAYASADHVNHIHWATSASLMTQIEARLQRTGRGSYLPLPADDHYFGDINGPAESHGGHPSASPHDRGYIARIQAALGIPEDGVYGQGTISSVRSFQSRNSLSVDGRVGRQTWEKLFPVG